MSGELSNDEVLAALREFESLNQSLEPMPFGEWRSNGGLERDHLALAKAKAGLGNFSSGFGRMGPPGGTNSYAPTGPRNRPSGEQAVGWNGSNGRPGTNPLFGIEPGQESPQKSKYLSDRPNQPPSWIDDVDMASQWYSPMEPVWPFGPPFYNRPREWDYPVGYNLNFIPKRLELYALLRGMRQGWGILGTIIETRKDQLLRLPWTIQRKDKPRASSASVDEMKKFFRRPDGKLTFSQWTRKLLDDLFVIDAPSLYINRNLGGKLRNVEVLDGATIFPLIDDAGRRPDTTYELESDGIYYEHRQPAFQQIIKGLPMINLSEDEIIYAMMHPRPELPMFGYSPIEQTLSETTEAIRKTFYQLEFWRDGSMPELIVTVPDNWNPKQIAMFQGHFDALLSGQLSLKSKVRFLPGGMKPFDIKNASGQSLWSERDELLVRLACYAFSVSPTPFVKQTNRGTAASSTQSAQEEGLYPLMSWFKDDIMDNIIQEQFGYEDIEFVFLPRQEVDLLKQAQIHQVQLREGMRTINEVREELGQEPVDTGNSLLIYTGAGALRLEDVVSGLANLPGAAPQAPKPQAKPPAKSSDSPGAAPMRGPSRPNGSSALPPTTVHSPVVSKVSHAEVKAASHVADRSPTKAQRHEGNFRKGHIRIQGLDVTIENAKGSKRREKDKYGRKWKVKMPAPYGYIRETTAADGMHMDCYIGKHPESPIVFVIDQDEVDPDGKILGFDEHKCMIGYNSAQKAIQDHADSHFDDTGLDRIRAVVALTMSDFKKWLAEGDMHKPIAEQKVGHLVARRGNAEFLGKSDTISSATGLTWYAQEGSGPGSGPVKVKPKKKSRAKGLVPCPIQ
jgi:hypothetical protein